MSEDFVTDDAVVGVPASQVITGYNAIDAEQLETINTIKASEKNVAALWKAIMEHDVIITDYELMRQARDHLTTGFMFLVRAVADPDDPFSFHSEPAQLGEVHGA